MSSCSNLGGGGTLKEDLKVLGLWLFWILFISVMIVVIVNL